MEWKIMYKYTDNTQSNFLDFNQPIGLHMNTENRWVKMADAIPWEIFEKKYSRLFKGKNGWVAKPLRLALGSLIIQTKYQYSEREEEAAERFMKRIGHYPERILADLIYRTRENRKYCKIHGIRLSGSKLGRPSLEKK